MSFFEKEDYESTGIKDGRLGDTGNKYCNTAEIMLL